MGPLSVGVLVWTGLVLVEGIMLACQSALLILHHLTFTNKSSPRTPAARAVLWPSVSYTTHTHTHASVGQDVACRMGNGEQQKASCRCKSGSLEKEPVGVFCECVCWSANNTSQQNRKCRTSDICLYGVKLLAPPQRDVDVRLCNCM